MKLLLIILIAFLSIRSSRTIAQSITFSGQNVELKKAFAAIEIQTGYTVVWSATLQKAAKPISITARNMPLSDFLNTILKDQLLTYQLNKKTIFLFKKNADKVTVDFKSTANSADTAKKITVKGRIVNEQGEPVTATITVKGTKIATGTNTNGVFQLSDVPENAVLIISGITIEMLEIKSNVDLKTITVKTKVKEEETVVIANTGYQKLKPNEITGSITVIDNKTLNQQTGTNIIDRLNGVTPGMLFNVGKKAADGFTDNPYSIRGINTINGNTSPLIILDNFQFDGDINNINPGDVESITVLKDAAAASIYGARGGNGVIVITTKRGRFNQKLKVEVNAAMIVKQKPDLYAIPQLSSAEYIYLEEFYYKNGIDFGAGSSPYYSNITPVINILKKRAVNLISPADSANQIDALKQIDYRDDLDKYFYQNAITRQYSLNLRGGSNNLAWLLSGSYDKSVGSLDEKADKINVKLLNEYKPLKNLNVSFSVYYTNASTQTGKTPTSFYRKIPYLNYADANGTPLYIDTKKDLYLDTVGAGHLLNWKNSPLEDYKHDKTTTSREQLVAGIETKYTFLKGLDLSLSYQYQREWGGSERYADIESFYARDIINSYTKLSRSSSPDTFYIPKGGVLQVGTTNEHSYNFRAQLGFQKEWQQRKHAVNALVAAERRELVVDGNTQYALYGYNKDPLTQGKVNFNIDYPRFPDGSLSPIPGAPATDPVMISRFISILGNVTYTYKERYSLSASARKDAANIFGLNTNDKWTPLWSAGVAWDISRESFYHSDWLPYVRLKFTYGYSGNVDVTKTALTIVTYNGSFTTPYGTPYADASRPNPDLRWEKKRDFNIAMEFATKRKTISGIIEYYQKNCTDLYGQTFIDYTTYTPFLSRTVPANIANTKGKGVDISITSRNVDKNLKWSTTLIFNYNRDIVTEYFSPSAQNGNGLVATGGILGYDGNTIIPVIGKPLYALAAMKWGGLDSAGNPQGYYQGKLSSDYAGLNGDANRNGINSTAVSYIGPANPPFFGSLINEISWKGFSININLLYSFGYYFRKPFFSQAIWLRDGTGYGDFYKRWQKPGDELVTNVPVLLSPMADDFDSRNSLYARSAINVLKADHIRLHYINVSYSFTHQQHFPLNSAQVYFNITDLGIVWRANKEKIDPLYPNSIPPSKSFTVGIRTSL